MKKLILSFVLLMTFSLALANNSVEKNESVKKTVVAEKSNEKSETEDLVTVTCTVIMADGTSHTATAGNWFSTTAGATRRCKAKLFDMMFTEAE